MAAIYKIINKIRYDERGSTVTDHMILLGLIAGGIAAGITAFCGSLGAGFEP